MTDASHQLPQLPDLRGSKARASARVRERVRAVVFAALLLGGASSKAMSPPAPAPGAPGIAAPAGPGAVRAAQPRTTPAPSARQDQPATGEAGPASPSPEDTGEAPEASGRARRGVLLDAVVATLDDALITRSDLLFEARVHALDQKGAAALSLSLSEPDLLEALERSLAERLHAREAERLGVMPPTPQELEAQLMLLESRAGGARTLEAFLRMNGTDRAQLQALIERRELSARARESRVRVRAQVTEAEIRRAWEASGSAATLAEDREAITARLRAERAREVEARELERLLRNARVRRIAPWARLAVGPGR